MKLIKKIIRERQYKWRKNEHSKTKERKIGEIRRGEKEKGGRGMTGNFIYGAPNRTQSLTQKKK